MTTVYVDTTVIQSIDHFFVYGLSPGLYVEKLLAKDPTAEKYAHPLLLSDNKETHSGHVSVVERLPDVFTGDNFKNWKGLSNMTAAEFNEIVFELKIKGCKYMEMILSEYTEDLKFYKE